MFTHWCWWKLYHTFLSTLPSCMSLSLSILYYYPPLDYLTDFFLFSTEIWILDCKHGWTYCHHSQYCYRRYPEPKHWVDARVHCIQETNHQGQLATIHDQYTNDFLVSLTSDLTTDYTSWIGGYKIEGDEWFWVDGSEWTQDAPNWVDDDQQGQYGGLEFNR